MERNWGNVIRVTGWVGVVASAINWRLTDQLSSELLALFATFAGVGEGVEALKYLAAARFESPDEGGDET